MKFGLKPKHVTIALVALGIIAAAYLIFQYEKTRPITHYTFNGIELGFRDDLRAANNISVSNETAISDVVWNPDLTNVTIVFVNSTDNGLVTVNSVEITYKLKLAYLSYNAFVDFNGKEVPSYEGLKSDNQSLMIALVPPAFAKETGVSFKGGVVYIQGTTKRDFDLATIKFLMTAFDIKV